MTENDINNGFDLKVRSIIEGGQEEVPAGLWGDIEKRLPAAATVSSRRPVFVRIIRASAATVAAASIAVGVIFTARQYNGASDFEILDDGPVLSDLTTTSAVPSAYELPRMSGRVPSSVTSLKDIEEIAEEEIPDKAVTEPTIAATEAEAVSEEPLSPSIDRESAAATVEPFVDDFPMDTENAARARRTTVSLGAHTNAASNGTSTKAGSSIMRRAAAAYSSGEPQTAVASSSTPVYGIPVSAGLSVKINFTDHWGLGVGVDYSYLSSRFDGVYSESGSPAREFSNIKNELHYIGIPVNVYYNIISNDIVNFYTFAGGSVEKGLSNKYRMVSPEDGTIIHKEKIGGFQYSAGLGLGVEFNIARHFGLYIDPSIRYWFDTDQPRSIRTQQPFMAQLDLGFRVNF